MSSGDIQKKRLVQLLRGLDYNKIDFNFLTPEIAPGKYEEGYDRFGKYKVRFGWGFAYILVAIAGFLSFEAFFPREARDYLDPFHVWIRENFWWIAPITLVAAFLVWRSDKKVEKAKDKALENSMEASGLEMVYQTDYTIPTVLYPELMFLENGTFKVKNEDNLKIIFGSTRAWWDPLVNPPSPIETLFIYVGIDSLTEKSVFASPFQDPDWDRFPPLSDKAKAAVAKLASKYLVRLGDGGLLIGYASDANNPVSSSLEASTYSKLSWKILYDLMSTEVADIVEGL